MTTPVRGVAKIPEKTKHFLFMHFTSNLLNSVMGQYEKVVLSFIYFPINNNYIYSTLGKLLITNN
jgi:hypothetical protein